MKALILAAGYATRLYPITLNQPKPLLKVGGKPIIEYILDNIDDIGEVDTIYVITNHKFKEHFDKWLESYNTKGEIRILDDGTLSNEDRLGPIGDMNFVIENEKVDDDLLVIAGDNLFEFSLIELVNIMKKKNSSVMAIRNLKDLSFIANKYGNVIVDEEGKITDFEEKPQKPKSPLAASATYLFKKEAVVEIGNCLKENPDLENSGDFIKYLIKKQPVYTYTIEGDWHDIGNKEELIKADLKYGGEGKYDV